jgi:hypothetical protein
VRSRSPVLASSLFLLAVAGCGQGSPVSSSSRDDAGTHEGDAAALTEAGASADGGGGQGDDGGATTLSVACNALTPAPSVLYLLFDASSGMRDLFGSGLGATLGAPLGGPLLAQAQEGLMYTPATQADCSSASNPYASLSPGGVPFAPASQAANAIATSLGNAGGSFPSGANPWYLEAAVAGAYSALEGATAASPINRRALVLFLDRDFNVTTPDCGSTHADAVTESMAASAAGVETYVVYLSNADFPDGGVPGTPVAHAQALANVLAPGTTAFFNASSQTPGAAAGQTSLALSTVAADLGSCLYETPAGLPSGAPLAFTDYAPLTSNGTPAAVSVSAAASCTSDDAQTNPLYVVDGAQIRFCPATCGRLQASLVADEEITAALNATRSTPVPIRPPWVTWDSPCAPDGG